MLKYEWAYDWEVVEYDPIKDQEVKRSFETETLAEEWVGMKTDNRCQYDIRRSVMQYLATER